MPDKKKT